MPILVRRSNLLVPVSAAEKVGDAWRHNADAITLDLDAAAVASSVVKDAIPIAGQGAAEIFVRVKSSDAQAGLEAAVWPGLRGIMLAHVESAADITRAVEIVTSLERARGMTAGAVQFIVMLESAHAVWHIRSIVTASPRITQVGIDESALAADMGIAQLLKYETENTLVKGKPAESRKQRRDFF